MKKIAKLPKLVLYLLLLLIALPVDLLLFALANSCASCSSLGQYLTSNYSLFYSAWITIVGLVWYQQKKKTSS